MSLRASFALFFPLLLAGVRPALAQDCPGGRIASISVDNHSIFDTSEMAPDAPFRWAYDLANTLHMETRKSFIRNELLFESGDCYDPLLLEESERILRNYPFIARVDVRDVPQPDGSHDVVVDTKDEWTTQLTVGVAVDRGFHLEKAELYENDFLGRGMLLGAFYEGKDERRDLGMTFETPASSPHAGTPASAPDAPGWGPFWGRASNIPSYRKWGGWPPGKPTAATRSSSRIRWRPSPG